MSTAPAFVSVLVPAELPPHIQHIVDHLAAFRNETGEPDFAAGELELMKLTAGLETTSVGMMLASLDPDAPRVEVDGRSYRRLNQRAESTYVTLRGEVVINVSTRLRHLPGEFATQHECTQEVPCCTRRPRPAGPDSSTSKRPPASP